jgi:hypothetical protein
LEPPAKAKLRPPPEQHLILKVISKYEAPWKNRATPLACWSASRPIGSLGLSEPVPATVEHHSPEFRPADSLYAKETVSIVDPALNWENPEVSMHSAPESPPNGEVSGPESKSTRESLTSGITIGLPVFRE